MYNVKIKILKKQIEMHLIEKNGAPWSEKLHRVGLLLILIGVFYGISVAEYRKLAGENTIIIEQALGSEIVRIDAESDGMTVVSAKDEPEDGDLAKNQDSGDGLAILIAEAFPENPEIMIAIAKAESGMNPQAQSTTDRMADGRAFSHGLFQINLTVSEIAGVKCHEAFHGKNYKAKVINEELFTKCIVLAHNAKYSIGTAREKYDERGNFTAWGAYTSGSYLRHL
jgi:hypothetical protein